MSPILLLVEDNDDDAELARVALATIAEPHRLEIASDAHAALDYLLGTGRHAAAPPPLPAVVLLDLELGAVDGLEVLRRVRAAPRTRALPVVVLTSSVEPDDVARSYAAGANSCVRKPIDFDEFARLAADLGRYWLAINVTAEAP